MAASDRQVGGSHYKMKVEPWDAMEAWMSPAEFAGFLRGNAIKYLSRLGTKGAAQQDAQKAQHYMEKLIEVLGGQHAEVKQEEVGVHGGVSEKTRRGRKASSAQQSKTPRHRGRPSTKR